MAYCTLADIYAQLYTAELLRLTDEAGTGLVDTTKVDTAIETADVEIDAYLGQQYSLPLATTLPIITKLSVDLAIRNLYLLNAGGIPESRDTQAANAVRMLEKIAQGKLTLGVGDPQAGSSDNSVQIDAPERIFSRAKLTGF